jgi:hypothetical protein
MVVIWRRKADSPLDFKLTSTCNITNVRTSACCPPSQARLAGTDATLRVGSPPGAKLVPLLDVRWPGIVFFADRHIVSPQQIRLLQS